VTDYVNYSYETDDEDEAYFICSVLNSFVVDALLRPFRRKEQGGHPHVTKKIFDVAPIPQFDPAQPEHRRLAELGRACSERVAAWLAAGGPGKTQSIGRLRGMVREMLKEELAEIDECTTRILGMEHG
jgi:hypothetical protein